MPRIGSKDFSVEFNDAVFETKAWQSSRYDGKELSGAQINKHTTGDVSFGKTPIIRNVTRNIYVGSAINDLDNPTGPDNTYIQFPQFSNITIEKYITINDDETISENNFDGSDLDSKNGFYRSFFEDFPIGGDFQIKLLDDSSDNFLNDNYIVYFNQGYLQPLLKVRVTGSIGSATSTYTLNNNRFQYTNIIGPTLGFQEYEYFNDSILQEFFTGSFEVKAGSGSFLSFLDSMFEFRNSNIGENRFFISLLSGSNTSIPMRTTLEGNFINTTGSLPTKNLAELSTAEIIKFTPTPFINFSSKTPLNQSYIGGSSTRNPSNYNGNFMFSFLNNSSPTILANLFASEQLPNTTGNLPFIVIPSNLHPYIKDNLLYFLGEAGIDIGNRRIPSQLDGQNRKLT